MKRIIPARCTACLKAGQELESDIWTDVRVCFRCYTTLKDFMLVEGFADSNEFFFSLVEPLSNGNYPYRMEMHDGSQVMVCMGPSRHVPSPSTFTTWYVQVPFDFESTNNHHDPLDNLFDT